MSVINHPPVAKSRPIVVFKAVRSVSLFLFAAFALVSAHAQIIEYPLLATANAGPQGITFAPDGAYWIAEFATASIGRIDTNGIVTTPFSFNVNNNSNVAPLSIIVGPDSNIWFTESM